MTTNFPQGFRCTPQLNEMYTDCEREVLPVILNKARGIERWAPHVGREDAIQEGRITLLRCLISYDINKAQGDLRRYVARALDNTFRDMFWRAVAQCRMPHGYVRDYDGEWKKTRMPVLSLDQMLAVEDGLHVYEPEEPGPDPADILNSSHLDEEARRFKMKMLNMLTGRDKDVFETKFSPSTAVLKMCDNLGYNIDDDNPDVPNVVVAKHLKVSKNKVDHSMYKIRRAFIQLCKDVDFSDLFGDVILTKGWPMIFVNDAPQHNKEFVRRILKERNLDPEPIPGWDTEPDHFQSSDGCARWVERYSWGWVMVLKRGEEWRTVVIEGDRINLDYGFVFGTANGANIQEELKDYIPWYGVVAKKLKEARRNGKN